MILHRFTTWFTLFLLPGDETKRLRAKFAAVAADAAAEAQSRLARAGDKKQAEKLARLRFLYKEIVDKAVDLARHKITRRINEQVVRRSFYRVAIEAAKSARKRKVGFTRAKFHHLIQVSHKILSTAVWLGLDTGVSMVLRTWRLHTQ